MCMLCYLEVVISYIDMYNVYYICTGYLLHALISSKGSNSCSVTIVRHCFFHIDNAHVQCTVCFFVVICMSDFRTGDNNWS